MYEVEWPTWCLILVVYGSWLAAILTADAIGPALANAALAVACCWYMSLQHELLHGHPTRKAWLNRLMGLAPLAVWTPYDLYRQSHLSHHRDALLTEPDVDPESNYVRTETYQRLSVIGRALRWLHRTLLGRMLFGPLLVIVPMWWDIVRLPLRGDMRHTRMWAEHLSLLVIMLWLIEHFAGIEPLRYLLLIAYPATSLALVRSFYEHRPAVLPAHRTVINDAGWAWRLLYLNNNYHAVHHAEPGLPWYHIRARWLAERQACLEGNGAFLVPGYGHLLRRHLLRPVDSPVFPVATACAPVTPAPPSSSIH